MARLLLPFFCFAAAAAFAQPAEQIEFFEKHVRPVFATKCQGCHNPKLKSSGLDLSTAAGFRQGGLSGPLVTASPENSRLLQVISYEASLKMPPTGKLKDDEIASLTAWVKMNAPWPGAAEAPAAAPAPKVTHKEFTEEQKKFWAFQPVRKIDPPQVKNSGWGRTAIDRFILAELEAQGLKPAKPADKYTLLRRATFDLTGLPPTEQELRDFAADSSPDAFRKVVDRLLASPRYGERWGRHWLDVARYADSTGNDEDHRYPYAWRYRDYVIESFNQDVPYDRMVREQIAGDLLPHEGGGPNRRGIVATGFLALGAKALASPDKKKMLYDVYDEQVDVVSRAFLGVTVACARCHDHKFDPILTKDYYSMISIFASTRSFQDAKQGVAKLLYTPLVPEEEYQRYKSNQNAIEAKRLAIDEVTDDELERFHSELTPHLADYMTAARKMLDGGAADASLRPEILQKWVAFLKPRENHRPYLDEWNDKPAAEVAQAYQKRAEATLAEWHKTLQRWRARYRKMLAAKNMPPPPHPTFEESKDPFFLHVYFDKGPFAVEKGEQDKVFSASARDQMKALRQEVDELKKNAIPEPDMACAVAEGDRVDQKVFIRGDYNSPGEDSPPAFPKILTRPGDPSFAAGHSGRLELAEWLARPENPLTARVMVNRVWGWHFGEGIVRTPDNFGRMGERPTHPELLDYLSRRFVESGWSMKSLHREIMLSNAYQMTSDGAEQVEKDPENRLFSRFPVRRLDVEEVRDALLAVDGSLDLTMGGTLQTGFGTDSENSNNRLSLNPEKVTRRTVYLPLRRANLPSLLNLFDFGDATTVTGKRASTNVAPQALFMMNSEFVQARSTSLAKTLMEKASLSPRERIESAILKVLNRPADAGEVDAAIGYLQQFESRLGKSPEQALQSFCKILLASNDFVYVF
jgi:cytochrome c553